MTDVTGTKILEQNLCTMLSEEVTREVTREGLLAGNLSFHSQYKTDSPDLQVVGDMQCWPHRFGGRKDRMGKVYSQVTFPQIPKGKLILLPYRKFGRLCWPHRFGGDDVCGGCRKIFAYE